MYHPTKAKIAIEVWRALDKTTPFGRVAKAANAFRDDEGATIVWIFPDDSIVRITGRGRGYTITAELP